MKLLVICLTAFSLSGCAINTRINEFTDRLTDKQKKYIVAGSLVLVSGAIAIHQNKHNQQFPVVPTPRVNCSRNPQSCL